MGFLEHFPRFLFSKHSSPIKGATSWDLKNVWDLSASAIEQTPVLRVKKKGTRN